jgi:PAS domain S-box-containing protein
LKVRENENMKEYPIVIISVVIQFVAAALALRLCWITEKITAWVLIALAISFMALRRCFTLYEWTSRGIPLQPLDITTEMVGLVISALMLAGVAFIAPLFLVIKQSEKKVKQSEEKCRFLVANIPAVVFMGYRDGTVDFLDSKVTEVTGYPKESFDSRALKWPDIVAKEDVEEAKNAIIHALKAERSYVREYRIRHKDGKVLWIQERSQIVCDEQGKINYINGVFYDITLRKQAEEALLESEARFRATFAGAPIGIILVDINGRLLESNRVFQQMLGYSSEEIEHMAFCKLSHPEDAPRCIKLLKEMITGKRDFYRMDYKRYLRKDGEVVWTRLQVSVVKDASGEPYFAIGMIEDITKQKRAEDEIRAYQERLRSLATELTLVEERERRRLATQLHENIGQILAFAKIKLGTLTAEAATSDLAADLNELRNQIDHTIQFTRSLTFELSPPTLYELGFEEAIEWLASEVQKNCGTEIDVQRELYTIPLTDEARILLFVVVRGLLTNVAKHAQARHAKVVINKEGDRLQIQVEDDGVGFNVAKSRTAGFGLFSIRERLDRIGGSLKVKSKPGHGTLVTLTIPHIPEDKMAESQQRQEVPFLKDTSG